MLAAIRSGYESMALDWPGRALDPDFRFNPQPPPFTVVQEGRLYSQYPPVFALLSSFPYRLFGFPGLYALPLLGGIATAAGA